jgi:hypothetical protein
LSFLKKFNIRPFVNHLAILRIVPRTMHPHIPLMLILFSRKLDH